MEWAQTYIYSGSTRQNLENWKDSTMRRLVCNGCGLAEDLNNPSGTIHPVKLVDMAPTYAGLDINGAGPDKPVEEDLCESCRKKLRRDYFGEVEAELLDMPLMKGA
jgi:hypothetical protein